MAERPGVSEASEVCGVSGVIVRGAEAGDLAAVAQVFLDCWHTSYAGFLPAEVAARYPDAESARTLWRGAFEPVPADGLRVAEIEGRVVGFASVHRAKGYLASLYVAPQAQGAGVGHALFTAAAVLVGPDRAMRWWVFSDNVSAVAAYRRWGGHESGRARVGEYGLTETELILDASSPPSASGL